MNSYLEEWRIGLDKCFARFAIGCVEEIDCSFKEDYNYTTGKLRSNCNSGSILVLYDPKKTLCPKFDLSFLKYGRGNPDTLFGFTKVISELDFQKEELNTHSEQVLIVEIVQHKVSTFYLHISTVKFPEGAFLLQKNILY